MFHEVEKVADSPLICYRTENAIYKSIYKSIYIQVNLPPTGIELGPSNIIFIIF